jgi:hypothetical protein
MDRRGRSFDTLSRTTPEAEEYAVMDSAWFAARQNPDGGWGYVSNGSATEPTVFALVALAALGGGRSESYRRGLLWFSKVQRGDGGFAPRPCVAQSTWVTALYLQVPGASENPSLAVPAMKWLLAQSGRESSSIERLRSALLGVKIGFDVSNDGWPWFPNTAAWVMPTALTLIALNKCHNLMPGGRVSQRISEGRRYLLARRCADGGWNHGASKALGYEAGSYPETTGIALLALAGRALDRTNDISTSLKTAERHLATTKSREAVAWLQMGLAAHGRPAPARQFLLEPRTIQEAALAVLAECALQGRNLLLV